MLSVIEISTSVKMLSIPKRRMSTFVLTMLCINETSQSVEILSDQE